MSVSMSTTNNTPESYGRICQRLVETEKKRRETQSDLEHTTAMYHEECVHNANLMEYTENLKQMIDALRCELSSAHHYPSPGITLNAVSIPSTPVARYHHEIPSTFQSIVDLDLDRDLDRETPSPSPSPRQSPLPRRGFAYHYKEEVEKLTTEREAFYAKFPPGFDFDYECRIDPEDSEAIRDYKCGFIWSNHGNLPGDQRMNCNCKYCYVSLHDMDDYDW